MELTKETIQEKIDHYSALADAYKELYGKQHEDTYSVKQIYCMGKMGAYIDIYNELFPEMDTERAFPLDEEKRKKTIQLTIEMHKYH